MYFEDYKGFRFHTNVGWFQSGDELYTSVSALSAYSGGSRIRFMGEYPGPTYRFGGIREAPDMEREEWQTVKWPTFEQSEEIEAQIVERLKKLIDEVGNV